MKARSGSFDLEIRVRGHLDERRAESLGDLACTHTVMEDGTPQTILRGRVLDEAELHGLLARIRDLGIPLLEVRRRAPDGSHDDI